jgi:hypothetical protein
LAARAKKKPPPKSAVLQLHKWQMDTAYSCRKCS